ncbi:MAG: transposase [Faecousia sp.]
MEQVRRKRNRLVGYDYSQPGAYFITVCTADRKCLLGSIVGADAHIGPNLKLSHIGAIVQKYTDSIPGIDRYVIMPNHVHMILRISAKNPMEGPMWASAPTQMNVEKAIRSWKTLISKAVGFPIWQRSYYDHIIRNEQEYIEIARYIEGNPGKWCEDHYFAEE